ncbi:unnamed protein product [Rotaria sordida]|uniref:Endoplasmic reticulum junction formation protein lunapark n=1 Tax=Rotaria sordida TaxID=392033 RepID=A0A815GZH8_9BILA|nr:unnamed protein product [Rotaria sordida]
MMNDFSRRVNSIVVKNLPTDFTSNQLEELFSPFGQILSSKVLPYNSNFEGGCGFVNYANAESCNEAVDHMNNYVIQGFTLRVSQSMSRSGNNNFNRSQNGLYIQTLLFFLLYKIKLLIMSFFNRLFKFRIFKFRATLSEELDDLQSELTRLQQTLIQTRLRQRQWTKWFAIYAILAYVIVNICYYTFFLPQDFVTQIYAFSISITFGILLYGIHWIMRWYFRKVIQMKEEKLELFKERKQELIEEVKNKETYAVAKNLLEKYGEKLTPEVGSPVINDQRPRASSKPTISGAEKPSVSVVSPKPSSFENGNQLVQTPVREGSTHQRPRASSKPTISSAEKPSVSVVSPKPSSFENGNQLVQTPVREGSTRLAAGVTPGKLPRAIQPPQRTFWGAILDTIVGDGPSKRYGLICKSCNSHNGMALEEEFEYLSFRCAYCNYFNGARKHKPVFNPDLFSTNQTQNENNIERMEISTTDSSDSTDPINESRITRRSIRVPITNKNEIRSRSISLENKHQNHPTISSSSDENLSAKN